MPGKTPIELQGELIASALPLSTDLTGEDDEDTRLLRKTSEEANKYISSFSWCGAILNSYFAGGVGGIFCVFLFHIRSARPDVDSWIWIGIGDAPPAYLPLSDCNSPSEFFNTYIRGLRKWVEFARVGHEGRAEDRIPPIRLPATPEWAEVVDRRIQALLMAVKPFFEDNIEPEN